MIILTRSLPPSSHWYIEEIKWHWHEILMFLNCDLLLFLSHFLTGSHEYPFLYARIFTSVAKLSSMVMVICLIYRSPISFLWSSCLFYFTAKQWCYRTLPSCCSEGHYNGCVSTFILCYYFPSIKLPNFNRPPPMKYF